MLAAWKDDYNTVRPPGANGNVSPLFYANLNDPAMQHDGSLELPRDATPPSQCNSIDIHVDERRAEVNFAQFILLLNLPA